eukprot:824562-Amphidinium_carterae.1
MGSIVKWFHVAILASSAKPSRLVRVTAAVPFTGSRSCTAFVSLQLLATRRSDNCEPTYLVLDFQEAFWQLPAHLDEHKFFATCIDGVYYL